MAIQKSSLENFINDEGSLLYKVNGKSMLPMLRPNRDLVYIRKKRSDEFFKENDVVLYKWHGRLILHRIVHVRSQGVYDILGDNASRIDRSVSNDEIIGILHKFYRDNVAYEMDSKIYLSYVNRTRQNERLRIRKKYIYDLIVSTLSFLPVSCLEKLKRILKFLLNYNYRFE
jgi:hypothetical protein